MAVSSGSPRRLRPRVLTASAKTGRNTARLLTEAIALADRAGARIPTPELNRFLSEALQARQPPVGSRRGRGHHRLKLIYMTQIGVRPPRFAVQVNSRARVTRDYAYFLENRLRARYGMDGVPLIIDFVERGRRRRSERRPWPAGEPHDGDGERHGAGESQDGAGESHDGAGERHDGAGEPRDGPGAPANPS